MQHRSDVSAAPRRPIGFAHRGAAGKRHEQNTLDAFARALAAGAAGVESDIALTADGIPVLAHPNLLPRRGPRIARTRRADLPAEVPSLSDLYERCGNCFELSLDMAAPTAIEAVMAVAARYGAAEHLWITYWRLPQMQEWRRRWPEVKLVYPTLPLRPGGISVLTDSLRTNGVDVLNLHHRFCRPATIDSAHRAGLLVFAWGIKRRNALERALARGVDGVYADDLPALVELTA